MKIHRSVKATKSKKDAYKNRMAAEVTAKDAKAAKIIAKNTPPPAEEVAPVVEEVATPEADAPQAEA
jgi:hypothetical protein